MSQSQKSSEYDLGEVLLLALDEKMTPEQNSWLNEQLICDPKARAFYFEFMTVYAGFSPYENAGVSFLTPSPESDKYHGFLSEMARDEKAAPQLEAVDDEPAEDRQELIQKVHREKMVYRFKKHSAISALLAAAAILLLLLFVRFGPTRSGREVATLSDSIDAEWADSSFALRPGVRLLDSDPTFVLRRGYAKLVFDNQAEVVLEGPSEFKILSDNQVWLDYGRLYATVPESAQGFTVQTAQAKTVDLGTEFGIKESLDGETEIHVIKGKVKLLAELKGKVFNQIVAEGLSRRVCAASGQIHEIAFHRLLFARRINSSRGMVWKGRMTVDLADIIGGGNGRGTGQSEIGIDPLTGKRYEYFSQDRQGSGRYVPVSEDRYIDGVFVPQGEKPQVVSSKGHVFKECPKTNNIFYAGIVTGSAKNLSDYNHRPAQASLGGKLYGTLDYPSIFMHANLGVTFDLAAIRADLPGFSIDRFVADAGLSSDAPRQGNVDVWVLIDGQVRYSSLGFREKGKAISIDVPLKAADRFLSLVVTDGRDQDHPEGRERLRSTDSDWCVFGCPRLGLSCP